MSGLTFDAATHTYRLDGVEVPSVTQVLTAVRLINLYTDGSDMQASAMARGMRCHALIQCLAEGWLDEARVAEEDRGYVNAARCFLADAS